MRVSVVLLQPLQLAVLTVEQYSPQCSGPRLARQGRMQCFLRVCAGHSVLPHVPSCVSQHARGVRVRVRECGIPAVYVCVSVQVAETLLRKGFSPPGSGPIDIFGVAAALAQGDPSSSLP